MRARYAVGLVAGGAMTLAACAQVLGIADIHDDPSDAGPEGAPPADVAVEGSADSGPDGPVAEGGTADGSNDAPPDGAPPVDPALGCSAPDGGSVEFLSDVSRREALIALDSKYVYIGGTSSMFRCSLEGCAGTTQTITTAPATGLAANGEHLFWSDNINFGHLHVATPGGSDVITPVLVAGASLIARAGADVYVLEVGGIRHLYDAPGDLDASVDTEFARAQSYEALAASSKAVAFVVTAGDGGSAVAGIYVCPPGGCPGGSFGLTHVAYDPMLPPIAVAVDDNNVYWTDPVAQTIDACPISGCTANPVIVSSVVASSLFLDSTSLYWGTAAAGASRVYKAQLDGSSPVLVANTASAAYSLVANDKCVYWSTSGVVGANTLGSVWAAPQP